MGNTGSGVNYGGLAHVYASSTADRTRETGCRRNHRGVGATGCGSAARGNSVDFRYWSNGGVGFNNPDRRAAAALESGGGATTQVGPAGTFREPPVAVSGIIGAAEAGIPTLSPPRLPGDKIWRQSHRRFLP